MQPVHFHWNGSSLKLCAVFVTFLFVLGLPMLVSDELDVRLAGIGWMFLFAWLMRMFWRRLQQKDPVITIDALGLFDRRMACEGFLWDEIASVEAFEAENTHWVELAFADPKRSLSKTNRLVRACAPLQRLMGFPRVAISMSLLDGSTHDLLAAIRSFRPELISAEPGH